jgi:hypothetical protein
MIRIDHHGPAGPRSMEDHRTIRPDRAGLDLIPVRYLWPVPGFCLPGTGKAVMKCPIPFFTAL